MARKTTVELVEQFADMGSRSAFSLQGGVFREGYLIDVGASEFTFAAGGPLAPEVVETIAIVELDFSTLAFFDSEEQRWKHARWVEDAQRWVFSNRDAD